MVFWLIGLRGGVFLVPPPVPLAVVVTVIKAGRGPNDVQGDTNGCGKGLFNIYYMFCQLVGGYCSRPVDVMRVVNVSSILN